MFKLVLFFLAQLLITGSLTAFGIVSRMHEDKAFPKVTKGNWCPRIMHRGRLHLILILIGVELVVVAAATVSLYVTLGDTFFIREQGYRLAGFVSFVVIIVMIVIVSIAGVGLAAKNPRRFAFVVSYPLFPLYLVFRPVTALFLRIISMIFPDLPREIASPFLLFSGPEESGDGFIEENGRRLIHSIVEFQVTKVREVMVPRIDVFAIDVHTPIEDVWRKVSDAGHSRVPVYDGSIDRISGILYVKDLLRSPAGRGGVEGLERLLREAYFVPEGKKIDDLLREFQREKKHIAIVVDEYGGTSGVVTLEDILEEIVGEIRDEYDQEIPLLREVEKDTYVLSGKVNINELNETLKLDLPTDEADTLGGFLFNSIGRVPEEGEEILYAGLNFRISRLEGQRITEVLLRLKRNGKDGE